MSGPTRGKEQPDLEASAKDALYYATRLRIRRFHNLWFVLGCLFAAFGVCALEWGRADKSLWAVDWAYAHHHPGPLFVCAIGGIAMMTALWCLNQAQEMEAHRSPNLRLMKGLYRASAVLPLAGLGLIVYVFRMTPSLAHRPMIVCLVVLIALMFLASRRNSFKLFPKIKADRKELKGTRKQRRKVERQLKKSNRKAQRAEKKGARLHDSDEIFDDDNTGPIFAGRNGGE